MLRPFFMLLIFAAATVHAQDITVIKSIGGTPEEPKTGSQDEWENNAWNGKLFYTAKGNTCKLAVTDGTADGTKLIADLGALNILHTIPAKDFMYIFTNETVISPSLGIIEKLWKSDGTTAGTVLVKAFTAHSFSAVGADAATDVENERNYSVQNNIMYFTGYDATNGAEPWITDGTTDGTHLLKDIKTGAGPSYADGYIFMGGYVYFRAATTSTAATLWRTDGSESGTTEIAVPSLTIWSTTIARVNNKLVFIGNDNYATGAEPWVSDGTVAGTFQLKDINPGTGGSNTSNNQNIHLRFNDKHVFIAAFNGTGNALWRTDGSVSGTVQLTPDGLYIGTNFGGGGFCAISNQQSFWINDNSKLYVTDGTPAGTGLLRGDLTNAIFMKLYNGAAHFNSGAAGSRELWRSDGTTAGTVQYADIYPGLGEGYPYGLFTLNNSLYFFGNNGSGVKLMKLTAAMASLGYVFTGAASANWNDALNWAGGKVPGVNDTVFINSGTPFVPSISGTAMVGLLNLGANAGLSLPGSSDTLMVSLGIKSSNNTISGNGSLLLQGNPGTELVIDGGLTIHALHIRKKVAVKNGEIIITGH